jgi:glycerophosphoryl diester phosphodiesterase
VPAAALAVRSVSGVAEQRLVTVAHRAGNSLSRLRAALDAGVDLVEADIRRFRGVLEVRHRKALGRRLLWEDWRDVAWRHRVVVPVLAQVLAAAAGDPRLMLDLKGPGGAVAVDVAALLRRLTPATPMTVCTRQWRMLDAFSGNPQVRQVYSAGSRLQLRQLRARLRQGPVAGVSIRRQLLTPAVVTELRRATDLVMVWPVDTEAELDQARALGVTGVISNNLPLLHRLATA